LPSFFNRTGKRLKNCCIENKKEWHTPLGIFVTIILACVTTTFKNTLGLSADIWNALFIFFAVAPLGWLIKSATIAYKSPKIEDIIEKLKKNDQE